MLRIYFFGVGCDIIHAHPNCDPAALGRASYTDFLMFARSVKVKRNRKVVIGVRLQDADRCRRMQAARFLQRQHFQRSFTLPDDIDQDKIEASISDGLLRVFLQKAPEAQVKKIAVVSG